MLDEFEPAGPNRAELVANRQHAAAQALEVIAERLQTPAQRLERALVPCSTYVILPIFALANVGVELSGNVTATLSSPIFFGIVGGLVFDKPLGVLLFAWLAIRLGVAALPDGVSWQQLISASWLAGIGFTMSLFLANAAFGAGAQQATAKTSILIASVVAATLGAALL